MIKLNLGCGQHPMDGWINYDLEVAKPGITQLDLRRGILPHPNASVDFIFSEHACEHFTQEEGLAIMRECRRVLKPGGVLRISCPDIRHMCKSYMEGNLIQIPGCWEPKTLCQMVNEAMRSWAHLYLYDFEEITGSLIAAGFRNVSRCKHRESEHLQLSGLEVRPDMNDLIVEAS